jgi:hypothetical protein
VILRTSFPFHLLKAISSTPSSAVVRDNFLLHAVREEVSSYAEMLLRLCCVVS